MNTDLAEAVKEAQEALEQHDIAVAGDEWSFAPISLTVADALRALLAATEPAPEPVSNAYTLPEEVEAIIRSVAEHDCRCSLFADIGIFCDPCRARAFLAARGGRP